MLRGDGDSDVVMLRAKASKNCELVSLDIVTAVVFIAPNGVEMC